MVMMFMLKSETNAAGEKVYSSNQSFTPVYLIIAGFMLVAVLVMVLAVNENKVLKETNIHDDEEQEQNTNGKMERPVFISLVLILVSVLLWYMAYNAVTTAFSRYCVNIWGVDLSTSSSYLLLATVSAIAAFVPLGFLSSRFGRKKMVLAGVALMTVCYLIAIFLRQETPIMYAIFALVGIGWASINVNSFPMVVEMSRGSDVGKYTGLYYTFSMAAQIVTPLLSGLLIDKLSLGYNILFPYAVFFSATAFVTMSFVRHGDSRPEAKTAVLETVGNDN